MFDEKRAIDFLVGIIFAALAILAFDYLGQQSYADQIMERQKYIEMVCSGDWQDYKELKPKCLMQEQE